MNAILSARTSASALRKEGRHAAAAELLLTVLPVDPLDKDLRHDLGNALRAAGRHAEAMPHLLEAARLDPKNPVFLLNLGVTQMELEKHEAALVSFEQALSLSPNFPEAINVTACALLALGRSSEATARLQRALTLRPDYAPAHNNLGRAFRAQGLINEALASYEASLRVQPSPQTHDNALMALNYLSGRATEFIVTCHKDWAARYAQNIPVQPAIVARVPSESRIRIGYVSGDLCNHAVSFFLEPILINHDRSRFEVTCYSNTLSPDATTARLRSLVEQWRDIARLSDDDAAMLIRDDGIDILVDLSGHSAGNRLLVFARRPAPVQITWIGYPSTTGMGSIDYRITDALCIPPGDDSRHGTEKLLRLPGPFTCYLPPRDIPDTPPLPAATHGQPPVFCSFNNIAKLSEATLTLWARILRAIPGARLLIKSPGADDHDARQRIINAMTAGGVNPVCLQFHGTPLPMRAHLALYGDCHIALDPFPYNGTTTTCEALLMGIPVITLIGDTHLSRVGTSLLSSIGLPDLIAKDEHDYVEIACTLANDIPRLAMLRATMRERLLRSPLCKHQLFTHQYESALIGLLRQ